MDSLLKILGFGKTKDKPELGFTDNKQTEHLKGEVDTTHDSDYYLKQLDVWLEKNIPRQSEKIPLRQKAFDLLVLSGFAVGTVYFYKKDIHKFPRRDQFRYKWFTGCALTALGLLFYARWTDDAFYKPVEVKREPEDTEFDIRMKEMKQRLFPPGSVNLYDKYILGKDSESEASSTSDSKKTVASESSDKAS